MLLFDATHTAHSRAQTGIQRVCRSLFGELDRCEEATGVCYDPYYKAWRPLNAAEIAGMQPGQQASSSRSAKWSFRQRLASKARRLLGQSKPLPPARGLIIPELFSTQVAARLPEIFAAVQGPRVAIFYDAIPLKFPELTPAGTVARLPGYLRELLQFDGIAAISEDSAASLRDYWQWLGIKSTPPVQAIPLGVDPLNLTSGSAVARPLHSGVPRILSVGTIEGRKNHLALLDAAQILWAEGRQFELQLIGLPRPDTASQAIAKIATLQQAGHPLLFGGSVADAELQAAYRQSAFTVYPSLIEGFGLPVIESLQHGRPCICSGKGALAESARGGGCLTLESVDANSLAEAIRSLLASPAALDALVTAASQRQFKSWADYSKDLTTWLNTLSRRP